MTRLINSTARKTAIAASALALPALLMPTAAFANHTGGYYTNSHNSYERCKTDEKQDKIVGAVIGGVIGGVLGSQVAGDGVRTEGSAIGAGIGAIAGAGIADKQNDCKRDYRRGYSHNTTQTYGDGRYQPRTVYNPQPVYNPRPVYNPQPVYRDQGYTQPRYDTYTRPRTVYTTDRYHPSYGTPGYTHGKKRKRHKGYKYKRGYSSPVYTQRHQRVTYVQPVRHTSRHNHGIDICHGSH